MIVPIRNNSSRFLKWNSGIKILHNDHLSYENYSLIWTWDRGHINDLLLIFKLPRSWTDGVSVKAHHALLSQNSFLSFPPFPELPADFAVWASIKYEERCKRLDTWWKHSSPIPWMAKCSLHTLKFACAKMCNSDTFLLTALVPNQKMFEWWIFNHANISASFLNWVHSFLGCGVHEEFSPDLIPWMGVTGWRAEGGLRARGSYRACEDSNIFRSESWWCLRPDRTKRGETFAKSKQQRGWVSVCLHFTSVEKVWNITVRCVITTGAPCLWQEKNLNSL